MQEVATTLVLLLMHHGRREREREERERESEREREAQVRCYFDDDCRIKTCKERERNSKVYVCEK